MQKDSGCLSVPVLTVKAQEWGAALSAGDQGVQPVCPWYHMGFERTSLCDTHADALA